jgi:hypothetical protein
MMLTFDDEAVGPLEPNAEVRDSSGFGNTAVARYPESDKPPEVLLEVAADPDRGGVLVLSQPCNADNPDCLRGVLEVESAIGLDVGDADFSYGAHVRLSQDDLRDGTNIVQKGYSTGGFGQWKLQIDDDRGRPECILVGTGGEVVQRVKADRSVSDSQWHAVECRRDSEAITILIDGVTAGRIVPEKRLIISPETPIRVGGKNLKLGSDPYFGELDDVFLQVG